MRKRSTHPPETVARALELRKEGLTYREIAQEVGASPQSVVIWCSPRRAEIRRREKERKQRYKNPCIDCGKIAGYGATRCMGCHRRFIAQSKKWTEETIIAAIQRWAEEYGQPPKSVDWNTTLARKTNRRERDRELYPASNQVYGRDGCFPTWADAIEAAGFPRPKSLAMGTPKKRYWTEERIIEALRAHSDNGYAPMMEMWRRAAPGRPTTAWVIRVFGSWRKALETAGLEPHPDSSIRMRSGTRLALVLTDERVEFVERCMERKVLRAYITRIMWKKWGYPTEQALKTALTRRGVLEDPGWRYRFNRQLTQEEIEEGLAL